MDLDAEEMGDLKPDLIQGDQSDTKLDLPPEYCHYKDEGCELFTSCLNCPLPQCMYDQPRGKQQWLKRLRNREITKLFINEGKGVKELALIFGISQRTIQRALKSCWLATSAKEAAKQYKCEDTE